MMDQRPAIEAISADDLQKITTIQSADKILAQRIEEVTTMRQLLQGYDTLLQFYLNTQYHVGPNDQWDFGRGVVTHVPDPVVDAPVMPTPAIVPTEEPTEPELVMEAPASSV